MHRSLIQRLHVPVLLLTVLFFLFPHLLWAEEMEDQAVMTKFVTIDCQGVPIADVLNDISRQSGLEINYYQNEFVDESMMPFIPFSDEIEAIDAVVRLLRGQNTIIEFNNDQKNIDIRLFENIN